jgi:hypothetical protein
MRSCAVTWLVVAAFLIGPFQKRCDAQITLAWNPSTGPGVAGYNLCWGTNSGQFGPYPYTNYYPNTVTNATISNLVANEVCYFAVQAVSTNDSFSAFSNEEAYTNTIASNTPGGPPSPSTNGTTGTSSNTSSVASGGGGGGSSGSATNQPSLFWGVPPFLSLSLSNGQANLNIASTVGAALHVLGTTNDLSLDEWSAVTNVTVSNIASIAETNQTGQPQDLLDVAFVPGTLTMPMGATHASRFQYFRVFMPYDYIILADQVLLSKTNYTPRLIVVNMPGMVADDACYVNEAGSFIHCLHTNYSLQLISSGSTIRQVATTLANSLNLDWTSASEFVYSNGLGQILATVIETEPPTSDPVAGQNPPSAPIVINF